MLKRMRNLLKRITLLYCKEVNFGKFKHGGLQEKHAVATWNIGSHLSIRLNKAENQENQPVLRWPAARSVAGPAGFLLTRSSSPENRP
jgi:hypothetical protein